MSVLSAGDHPASTITHPLYQTWAPVWRKLAHVYEGSGGFLDGTYLVAHPREYSDFTAANPVTPTKKLLLRRTLARYENVAATILNQVRSALFRGEVVRTIGGAADTTENHPLYQWWQNVDAVGTCIDDYMSQTWTSCGLFGHIAHFMDRPSADGVATKADEPDVYLRTYTPLDVADWLDDDKGNLTAVRLLEVEPRTTLENTFVTDRLRQRLVTEDRWKLLDYTGHVVSEGEHGFGRIPVVYQYAKRRALSPFIGQSVLNDPQLYIDLYNLTSELRELLRTQTFSLLNVPLGVGPDASDIERVKANMGGTVGSENVLFTPEIAQFIQADTANVTAYQAERNELLRTIYRLSSLPWEADSRVAEAAASLKLKREDMNQILAQYADEAELTEYLIAQLWFRAEYGPDRWEQEWERAEVVIRYPDTFDVTPFAEILEQAQAAVALDMPPSFMKELKRRLVDKFLPDAPQATLDDITTELEKQAQDAGNSVIDQMKQRLNDMGARKLASQSELGGGINNVTAVA